MVLELFAGLCRDGADILGTAPFWLFKKSVQLMFTLSCRTLACTEPWCCSIRSDERLLLKAFFLPTFALIISKVG